MPSVNPTNDNDNDNDNDNNDNNNNNNDKNIFLHSVTLLPE